MRTDDQLLAEYIECGSATAFENLVERYGKLVYGVARRRLNDTHLAEDVTQATFLLLSQRAAFLRREVVLAGWLFNVARLTAADLDKQQRRRQRRERDWAAASTEFVVSTNESHANWDRVASAVDEAIAQLRTADRNAIVLRFLEGNSHAEVGAALGISEAAAKMRLTRAVGRLRTAMQQGGVRTTKLELGAMLALRSPSTLPTTLGAKLASNALAASDAKIKTLVVTVSRKLIVRKLAALTTSTLLVLIVAATSLTGSFRATKPTVTAIPSARTTRTSTSSARPPIEADRLALQLSDSADGAVVVRVGDETRVSIAGLAAVERPGVVWAANGSPLKPVDWHIPNQIESLVSSAGLASRQWFAVVLRVESRSAEFPSASRYLFRNATPDDYRLFAPVLEKPLPQGVQMWGVLMPATKAQTFRNLFLQMGTGDYRPNAPHVNGRQVAGATAVAEVAADPSYSIGTPVQQANTLVIPVQVNAADYDYRVIATVVVQGRVQHLLGRRVGRLSRDSRQPIYEAFPGVDQPGQISSVMLEFRPLTSVFFVDVSVRQARSTATTGFARSLVESHPDGSRLVAIGGDVQRPGTYALSSGLQTMAQLLATAGPLYADAESVTLRRRSSDGDGKTLYVASGHTASASVGTAALEPSDEIFVRRNQPTLLP